MKTTIILVANLLFIPFFISYSAADQYMKPGSVIDNNLLNIVEERTGEKVNSMFDVDFDNDSKPERVVSILCGNSGCVNLIFRIIENGRFEYLTSAFFHESAFQLRPDKEGKFSDIVSYSRVNVNEGCIIEFKYNGLNYKEQSKKCGSSELYNTIEKQKIKEIKL